ncbi:MAG TPA: hypothetical protein VJH63_01135 [Candidatus Paceibacterota bacterium]
MRSIIDSHHAIFREGDVIEAVEFFRKELENRGINMLGNPDIVFLHFEALGIGEARELIEIASSAPFKEEKKIMILSFDGVTREAQNALLKLFEDPNPRVKFLIAGGNSNILLSTLRSRLHIIRSKEEKKSRSKEEKIKKFLDLSIGQKLKEVEKMIKQYKDDGDKKPIRKFLSTIFFELEKNPKENTALLKATAKSLSYIDDKSASVKLLLESVVLAYN